MILNNWINNIRLNRAITNRNLCILYHSVGNQVHINTNIHHVTESTFSKQIRNLKKRFEFVNEHDFFNNTSYDRPKVLLTFDDNYRHTLQIVAPFLDDEKIPYVFFINSITAQGEWLWRDKLKTIVSNNLTNEFIHTYKLNINETEFIKETKNPNRVNSKRLSIQISEFIFEKKIELKQQLYNTTAEIKEFSKFNMIKFGNHSYNHYCLSTLNPDEQASEISSCDAFLKQNLPENKISQLFSVPFGSFASYNEETIKILKKYNYTGVLMSAPHYYYNKKTDLSLEKYNMMGYKRFLPKGYHRF